MSESIVRQVPFFDLSRKISRHRKLIDDAIERVLNSGQLVLGKECANFEKQFAAYIGVDHCIGVANGTDAIELALRATGIQAGMKVATAANAGNYSSSAIQALGATPILMEVEFATRNINLASVKKAISAHAKAIVVTHLYGLATADILEIASYCRSKDVILIEDCAQAHGAIINGRSVGSFGDAAAFSFYPTKNLGALGDAGAVLTNNEAVAGRARQLGTYGWSEKYSIELPGGRNSRLDELQAAILIDLLPFLNEDNEKRRNIAKAYCAGIVAPDISLPTFANEEFVAHLFVVSSSRRNEHISRLKNSGVSTSIHFPNPDHLQPYLKEIPKISLPITERLAGQVFSLPCYPELLDEEVGQVIQAINGE